MKDKNDKSLLMSKYKTLRDLYERMTSNLPNRRPNCEEILEDKQLWDLNKNEFDAKQEFDNIIKSNQDKDSYVIKLINHFLLFNPTQKDKTLDRVLSTVRKHTKCTLL